MVLIKVFIMNLLMMKLQAERAEANPGLIGERFSEPSLTVPDESLSVHDILLNFSRGTLPPVSKQSMYYDEDFVDHPLDGQVSDLTDREIAQMHTQNLLDDLKSQQPEETQKDPKKEPKPAEPDIIPTEEENDA